MNNNNNVVKTHNNNNNNNYYYNYYIYKSTTCSTPTPAATNNNIIRSNANQACAACKYQRRKCAPDCILAPYFPHDRQQQFLNAHKLFGVSNITKIIRYLDQPDKDEAMRTIIYQSDVRANDPVGGCYRIIRELQRQIEYNRAELQLVLHQLAYCRAQNQNNVSLLHSNNSGSFEHMIANNHNDNVQQHYNDGDGDQIQQPDDQDQQQYILQNGDDDCDQVQFEEINSWDATENSVTTLEAKKNCDGAENLQENINVKPVLDDKREEFKYEVEEKSFDSVNNFRLKSTPAI
ncbi:LOB domain-containing protein [Heracleum sosnowskyi]|uniref:LOB domain-containing protein n=1 Tax=Heracleum sosnowskyi TaxID=360622 RepID=A0AAD8I1M6_9APIA|nr:LOB domain-containing protein [Heracleum sosnowskyi]